MGNNSQVLANRRSMLLLEIRALEISQDPFRGRKKLKFAIDQELDLKQELFSILVLGVLPLSARG